MCKELEIREKDINRYRNVYKFKKDHVHRTWEKLFQKGECTYRLSDFNGEYHEYSAFGVNNLKYVRALVFYSTLASILFFGFGESLILRTLSFGFYFFAILAIPSVLARLKTSHWVAFSDQKGDAIITLRIEGLESYSRDEIIEKITSHIMNHNQTGIEMPSTSR